MIFTLARRTQRMNSSAIREILKLTERPGVLSMAGGLPAPASFPIEALQRACDQVLSTQGAAALQYAATEGLPPLREWIARRLSQSAWQVEASQVLITTGSQQGLDLVGKVMLDEGSPVLVEQPTYLGALQAFAPYEPVFRPWASDAEGPLPSALSKAEPARLAYLVPNFQNPSGHGIADARRREIAQQTRRSNTPLLEDDPYGELWFDAPPPPPLAAHAPEQVIYLGSFSKVLAPGLRVGYIVTPRGEHPGTLALRAKLLQAKQASDLHTPALNQRIIMQLLDSGFDLEGHLETVRVRYRAQRDAMATALARHLPAGCTWQLPQGGMFFWVTCPDGIDTLQRLPSAVEAGAAYVPGVSFYAGSAPGQVNTMRLSFVTLSPSEIDEAVSRLARCLV
ncbi:MAG: PLP-dependent aminotransferase family protein [Aquabacterium sp.]|uniref:aminotransferase-like domain-containing protein n=1 Tax=Aquabacterium sp. TaxID=1872578 RepID=UPI00271786A2|nr:PLP-dependent aminotransferase family protein [Aquabacterium sp.]MDO9002508.1 PLP-dependent aminotransferase family protein [Aquabacterium sp.]